MTRPRPPLLILRSSCLNPHYSRGFVTKPPRRQARRARGAQGTGSPSDFGELSRAATVPSGCFRMGTALGRRAPKSAACWSRKQFSRTVSRGSVCTAAGRAAHSIRRRVVQPYVSLNLGEQAGLATVLSKGESTVRRYDWGDTDTDLTVPIYQGRRMLPTPCPTRGELAERNSLGVRDRSRWTASGIAIARAAPAAQSAEQRYPFQPHQPTIQ